MVVNFARPCKREGFYPCSLGHHYLCTILVCKVVKLIKLILDVRVTLPSYCGGCSPVIMTGLRRYIFRARRLGWAGEGAAAWHVAGWLHTQG